MRKQPYERKEPFSDRGLPDGCIHKQHIHEKIRKPRKHQDHRPGKPKDHTQLYRCHLGGIGRSPVLHGVMLKDIVSRHIITIFRKIVVQLPHLLQGSGDQIRAAPYGDRKLIIYGIRKIKPSLRECGYVKYRLKMLLLIIPYLVPWQRQAHADACAEGNHRKYSLRPFCKPLSEYDERRTAKGQKERKYKNIGIKGQLIIDPQSPYTAVFIGYCHRLKPVPDIDRLRGQVIGIGILDYPDVPVFIRKLYTKLRSPRSFSLRFVKLKHKFPYVAFLVKDIAYLSLAPGNVRICLINNKISPVRIRKQEIRIIYEYAKKPCQQGCQKNYGDLLYSIHRWDYIRKNMTIPPLPCGSRLLYESECIQANRALTPVSFSEWP